MLLEILIMLEIVAFLFLALGILPIGGKDQENNQNLPLMNRIIFFLVAAIIFFTLGMTSNHYDYTYCFVNETLSDFSLNTTFTTATCQSYFIENGGLSAINLGLAMVTVVLMIVVALFAITSRHDNDYHED